MNDRIWFASENEVVLFIKKSQLNLTLFSKVIQVFDVRFAKFPPVNKAPVTGLVGRTSIVDDDVFILQIKTEFLVVGKNPKERSSSAENQFDAFVDSFMNSINMSLRDFFGFVEQSTIISRASSLIIAFPFFVFCLLLIAYFEVNKSKAK